MKKRYGILAIAMAVLLTAGCGAAGKEAACETSYSGAAYDMAAPAEAPGAMPETEEMAVEEMKEEPSAGEISSNTGIENPQNTGRKLIKTVNLAMETKEFDTLLESIRQQVEDIGGYIENSSVQGNSYYNTMNSNRYAWLTLRIPSDKLDGFETIVGEMGNVISRNESVEDITLQYVDVKSHKEALLIEQERLMTLLEQAESMEDIIAIESRLSEVRYQLQSYESTLRTYDNKVDYSTVTIDVNEVERETTVLEEKSFLEEVRYRLSDNFYAIGQGFRNFAIWFISSLPYLLIWAAVIFVLVLVIRRLIRRRPFFGKRKKKEAVQEQETTDNQNKE